MKRQMYTAVLLLVLLTAATVIAGNFELGSLNTSVSASAVCGELTLADGTKIPHYFNNVTKVTNSDGCTYTVCARYTISWTSEAHYTTSKKANIKQSGHVYVVDSNLQKSGAGHPYSFDKDVKGGWFGAEKTDSVFRSGSFEWSTCSSGCYTARNDGEGSATTADGGSANISIEGVKLKVSFGFSDPVILTGHVYTTSHPNTIYPVFTHRAEDDFYVGNDTKYLSNYTGP